MKYVILIVFFLAAWLLIDEFVLRDRGSEGLDSYLDKLKDLGRRFHLVFGILAVLIIIFMIVRFIVRTVQWP
jgi:hypothetical protein